MPQFVVVIVAILGKKDTTKTSFIKDIMPLAGQSFGAGAARSVLDFSGYLDPQTQAQIEALCPTGISDDGLETGKDNVEPGLKVGPYLLLHEAAKDPTHCRESLRGMLFEPD